MLSGSRNFYFNLIFFSLLLTLIFLVLLLLGYLPSWLISLKFLCFPYHFVFSWQIFFFYILIECCIYCIKSLISRSFFMFPWTCLKSRILVFFFLLESIFLSSFLRIWINHFFPKNLLLLSLALLRFLVSVCVFQSQSLRFSATSGDPGPLKADCSCVQCERGFSSNSFIQVWVDRDSDSFLGGIPNCLYLPTLPLVPVCFPSEDSNPCLQGINAAATV